MRRQERHDGSQLANGLLRKRDSTQQKSPAGTRPERRNRPGVISPEHRNSRTNGQYFAKSWPGRIKFVLRGRYSTGAERRNTEEQVIHFTLDRNDAGICVICGGHGCQLLRFVDVDDGKVAGQGPSVVSPTLTIITLYLTLRETIDHFRQ